jgi:GAF domain-containing protein
VDHQWKGLRVAPDFDFLDLGYHEEQVRDLIARLNDLRAALEGAGSDPGQLQEALLLELENTVESMQTAREELRVASEELADRQLGEERERHLLRAVYGGLPVGVVLLDDDLRIRRINSQAASDLGTSPHYVAGRPFTVFVALPDRASFRARFSAARRDGTPARFPLRLLRQGQEQAVTIVLTTAAVSHEHDEVVMLAIMAAGADAGSPRPAPERDIAEEPPAGLVARVALQVDMMAGLAELLVGHTTSDDGPLLDAAARLLARDLADWALVDLVPTGGAVGGYPAAGHLTRSSVVGPGDGPALRTAAALAGAAPERAPLVHEVLEWDRPADRVMVDDPAAFGTDEAGVPWLARMDAHSVACFPLRADGEILGAVTVVRGVGRPPFDFAELGLLERLVDLVGLALGQVRVNRRHLERARTLQVAVQPGTLPEFPGADLACAYQPPANGEAVGRQFADAFGVARKARKKRQLMLAAGQIHEDGVDPAQHAEAAILARHAVRLYGSAGLPAAEVLRRTREVLRIQAADHPALSLVLAGLRAEGDRLVADLLAAANPAALLLRQAGPVRVVGGRPPEEDEEDGATPAGDVRVDTVTLEPGDLLLLHCGIVAEDDPGTGVVTLDKLSALLAALAGEPADRVVTALDRELAATADRRPDSGWALVAVRAVPPSG